MVLSGLLVDGSEFSFELNSIFRANVDEDFFHPDATLTVTLGSHTIILGDANLDGEVNFLDINPFIGLLASNTYLQQADCNQDGVLNFLDIAPFITILSDNSA